MAKKKLYEKNENFDKENKIDWVGGTGQAHFLSMFSAKNTVQCSKEFDINCKVLSPKIQDIITSDYIRTKAGKNILVESEVVHDQGLVLDDNMPSESDSVLTILMDENNQLIHKNGLPMIDDFGQKMFLKNQELDAVKQSNLYSEEPIDTNKKCDQYDIEMNKNPLGDLQVSKNPIRDIEILDMNSNFFVEMAKSKLLYTIHDTLITKTPMKMFVRDI